MTTTLTSPPAAATLPKPNGDFYQLTESLNDGDRAVLQKIRAFMETSVAPVINKYWADDAFPFDLLPGFRDPRSPDWATTATSVRAAARCWRALPRWKS